MKWLVLAVLVLALSGGGAESAPSDEQQETQRLIEALADADASVRSRAAQRLSRMGQAARGEIIKASRGANAEQRAQAARILAMMPWDSEADPPDVRELLARYGQGNEMTRASIIGRLYELRATEALLRLLAEEPSDFVRWMVVWALSDLREADVQALLRKLEPADDDPQALVVAGRAWIERDRAKALKFLRRAIDADASRPSSDAGMLDFAFEQLLAAAMEKQDFEQAAALLRRQVPRDLTPRRMFRRSRRAAPPALPRLLALHEYFGPLRNFAWDCQTWGVQEIEKARLPEMLTMRLTWLGFAPPLRIGLTSQLSLTDRYAAGSFLADAELTAAADVELDAAARMLEVNNEPGARGGRDQSGREFVSEMLCELHWRRARAAHDAGDMETANREVQRCIGFDPGTTDSAIRIINWLKETNRTKEAATFFKRIYDAGQERIEQATVKAGWRNDLAWLCARTGEKLEEAVKLAQQAVEEMPEMSAFLDTLAEAKYRMGAKEEAIELERRALQLSPDSRFMKEQLERFQAGRP